MRLVKIGIGNVDTTVGAVRSNTDRVVAMAREMAADDVTVGCFPEQCLGGYPPEDLVQWHGFVDAQRRQLERLARETEELPTVLVVGLSVQLDGRIFNSAAVVHRGSVVGVVPKEKLPSYRVFYEARTLARGVPYMDVDLDGIRFGDFIFEFDFGVMAVEVCEDAWSPDGPMRRRCYSGAELSVNVSSSPYRIGVPGTRKEMLATRSADNEATVVYANNVGAQDGLVFDGGGYVFQNGRLVLDAPRFREGLTSHVVDLDRTRRLRTENSTWRSDCEHFLRTGEPVPEIRAEAACADRSGLPYPAPPGGGFFLPPEEPVEAAATLPGATALPPTPREAVLDDIYEALALGVRDYYVKTGAFRRFGIAVSGGRDSVLTLLVARRAVERLHPELDPGPEAEPDPELEPEHDRDELDARVRELITAFYMPTRFSGDATRAAARRICADVGVELREVSIDEAFERELEATREMLGGEEPDEITRQNIQARLRGARMWNWANTADALFLNTGDMSERAVGYTTIGGDLEGALAVISNVPKTVVVALLERLYERFGHQGIRDCLDTRASPELAPEQDSEEELMPFPVLDACLYLFGEEKMSPGEVARALPSMFPDEDSEQLAAWARQFVDRFVRSIYKWVQSPLSLHIGRLDLDRERAFQLPVVQSTEWADEPD